MKAIRLGMSSRPATSLLMSAVLLAIGTALAQSPTGRGNETPDQAAILSAQKTSDLMLATLFAALGQEFAETKPDNVEEGKRSISLIFNDSNKDMRLVGVLNPLKTNDAPQDSFEAAALAKAMHGQNHSDVMRLEDKWYYRRSVALSNFHTACAMCHANFGPVNDTQWAGALMLRVPIVRND
jgi:hypothetical protein